MHAPNEVSDKGKEYYPNKKDETNECHMPHTTTTVRGGREYKKRRVKVKKGQGLKEDPGSSILTVGRRGLNGGA